MRGMRYLRTAAVWLSCVCVTALVGQYVIVLGTEYGLFNSPTERVQTVFNVLTTLVHSHAFSGIAGFIIGTTLGLWLDSLSDKPSVKRIFPRFEQTKPSSINREAVASELENLSGKLAALAGEYSGPIQVAW